MYRFQGSYRTRFPNKLHNDGKQQWGPRGVRQHMREVRRIDAEARNAQTPHERTKAHRMLRCGVQHT